MRHGRGRKGLIGRQQQEIGGQRASRRPACRPTEAGEAASELLRALLWKRRLRCTGRLMASAGGGGMLRPTRPTGAGSLASRASLGWREEAARPKARPLQPGSAGRSEVRI